MISKKLGLSIFVLALAGVIAVGLQKGWIGKRVTPTEIVKSSGPVSIELSGN
jgi:hypothetical protein